jgi:hypothetical protein
LIRHVRQLPVATLSRRLGPHDGRNMRNLLRL